jgi:tol-pal system protein YbgF
MRIIMKGVILYSLVFLGFSTMLVQCVATQKDMEYTNIRVRQMDSKVENIDQEIDKLKNVQTNQAEAGDRLDYQQSEILRLQGQIEEQTFLVKQIQEENQELKKLLKSKLDASEQSSSAELKKLSDRMALDEEQMVKSQDRLAFIENEIVGIKDARSMEAADRAREAAQRAREAEKMARQASEKEVAARQIPSQGPKEIVPDTYKVDVSSQNITEGTAEEKEEAEQTKEVKTETLPAPKAAGAPEVTPAPKASAPAEVSPPPKVTTSETSYDKGLSLFKQKKYRDAYNAFADYLDKNPSGSQAVEARYYSAESLFEEKDYELAILEFQKVIVENPQNSLAPKALYRQGLAFEKIGDQETARIVYNKLVDTYPKSEEMESAKKRIDAMKK